MLLAWHKKWKVGSFQLRLLLWREYKLRIDDQLEIIWNIKIGSQILTIAARHNK